MKRVEWVFRRENYLGSKQSNGGIKLQFENELLINILLTKAYKTVLSITLNNTIVLYPFVILIKEYTNKTWEKRL